MRHNLFTADPAIQAIFKERILNYFEKENINYRGNVWLYLKTFIIFVFLLQAYLALILSKSPPLIIIETFLLAQSLVMLAINIGHDANHGSYSPNKKINHILGYSIDLIGNNSYYWKYMHNKLHHNFTNIKGIDPDIDANNFMIFSKDFKKNKIVRYQIFYWPFLYSMLGILNIFILIPRFYINKKLSGSKIFEIPVKEHFIYWILKLIYFSFALIIPSFFHSFPNVITTYISIQIIGGFTLAIIFQVAHITEITEKHDVNLISKHKLSWAVHQLNTTANFSSQNKITNWFTGGLNNQIEHHLFPWVSHVHYPQISKIIKNTCRELGLPYKEFKNFKEAFLSHLTFLRKVSN